MSDLTTESVSRLADETAAQTPCDHCGLPVPRSQKRGNITSRFCCFGCRLAHELARPGTSPNDDGGSQQVNTLLLRLGLGIFLAMNIMVFSWLFYSREWYVPDTGHLNQLPHDALAGLFAYLLMLLCTILIVSLGVPLAADALGHMLARAPEPEESQRRVPDRLRWLRTVLSVRLDTNALICIGVGAAYLISVLHTLQGQGSLYYDTAAMILVLVTLGYFLESGAKCRAVDSTKPLTIPSAIRVRIRRHSDEIEIDPDQIAVGDAVHTRAGECFPVDAVVLEGSSHVNESSLTGESKPRVVGPGHNVLAGTVNLDGPLWTEAHRVGDDRVICQTQQLLEEARMRQPMIQRLADRVTAIFVPAVVVLALGVFGWHTIHGHATRGLFDALSVLLISCPCALGLAAPLAAWSALRRVAQRGVIIDSAQTLERIAAIDQIFFDKTGTLTTGRLELKRIVTADGVDYDQALQWAMALESTSVHPIAESLTQEAQQRGLKRLSVEGAKTLPGLGVEARIAGRLLRLGSAKLADRSGVEVIPFDEAHTHQSAAALDNETACMQIYLLDENRVLARFDLDEHLRDESIRTVARLQQMGIKVEMLTGDQPALSQRLAKTLNVPFEASLLPVQKLDRITDSRRKGHCVAMVGDGINDGPVLGGVDVGFVMSSGADLAKQAGNVWLLADRLDRITTTVAAAKHCMRRIRMNLAWAFGYNLIGLTLAACGMLTPIVSALAMIASSLMVVATSRGAGLVNETNDRASLLTAGAANGLAARQVTENQAVPPLPTLEPAIISQA